MTADKIQAAQERCARATPGPWQYDGGNAWLVGRDARGFVVTREDGLPHVRDELDAEFCAHARTDLPAALADLVAARVECARLHAALDAPTEKTP